MGLVEIGASIAAALLVGTLTRGVWRTYMLLGLSVLAVYWFQPAVPLRSFDFWLPSLTLALVILTWFLTSPPGAWRVRPNIIALLIILGISSFVDLSRYFLPNPLFTTTAPRFILYLAFIVLLAVGIVFITWASRHFVWILSVVIVVLITFLILLKTPTLSLHASIFFRTLTNRPTDNALATDLRWLGFSYIAFRLIHVLRDKSRTPQSTDSGSVGDKQMGRLPELSLAEFSTYVVF